MIKSPIFVYSALFVLTFSAISTGFNFDASNILSTGHNVYSYISLSHYYKKYESLVSQLKEILKVFESAETINQQPKLSKQQLDNIQKLWTEFVQPNKDQSKFDVQNAIEKAFSKKSSSDTKAELKNIISKLEGDGISQLNWMLGFQLMKSIHQTRTMIQNLSNTFDLIQDSEQFRESSKIQNVTIRSREYLDKAGKYYQAAVDGINQIKNTPDILIEPHTLEKIVFYLKSSKIESDWAQREIKAIIDEINSKLESLSSAKTNHVSNLGYSLVNLFITGLEYVHTPTAVLTGMGKLLFVANAGVHTIDVVAHATGFYWTREEIGKLKECQLQLDPLKIEIENLLSDIKYGMEKLELKQFSSHSFD